MAKKRGISDKEKQIIRDLLEEEELLLDEFIPNKKIRPKKTKPTKKEKELIVQLIGESKKKYSKQDQKAVEQLLTRMPEPKPPKKESQQLDEDLLQISRPGDSIHNNELDRVFDRYPRIHRARTIRLVILTICTGIIFAFLAINSGFFNMDGNLVNKTMIINKTVLEKSLKNFSFAVIIDDASRLNEQMISLSGRLRDDVSNDGHVIRHDFRIIDDYSTSIKLTRIGKEYLQYFERNKTTSGFFNVTCRFRSAPMECRVDKIIQIQRPVISRLKYLSVEETVQIKQPQENRIQAFFANIY